MFGIARGTTGGSNKKLDRKAVWDFGGVGASPR